jgi:hypothetical protein
MTFRVEQASKMLNVHLPAREGVSVIDHNKELAPRAEGYLK